MFKVVNQKDSYDSKASKSNFTCYSAIKSNDRKWMADLKSDRINQDSARLAYYVSVVSKRKPFIIK